jgi:lysophospholipase L1-like esterase
VIELYTEIWPQYKQMLSQQCSDLGVPFVDINELNYDDGWYFIDHAHMTDKGYKRVGEYLAAWMKNTISSSEKYAG